MKKFSAVILAAGAGTRMNSSLPKVMHKLSGKPLIDWVVSSVNDLNPEKIVIVLGHKAKEVESYLKKLKNPKIKVVYQNKQLGSANALMQARKAINKNSSILVLSGDVPLIKTATLKKLLKVFKDSKASAGVLSAFTERPFGYGRVVRNGSFLEKIVEEKDANAEEKKIKEINSGIYCFDKNIWNVLSKIKPNNSKKEYYVTDTIEILKKAGKKTVVYKTINTVEVQGVNNRKELVFAEKFMQEEKIDALLLGGVTIMSLENVYISYDAKIGQDTIIYPGVYIAENVIIGKECVIKGASFIRNSKIGNKTEINYSYIEGAKIENNVKVGPFAHIRPETILKENVKVGNFSETKKAVIAKNSKVNHLSYIGDAEIGENVNIGAGTITCNYDGCKKHKTTIGSNSFVGSNVNLVAPVKVGKEVLIAAGSTITKDIPSGHLAIARARQELKAKLKQKR